MLNEILKSNELEFFFFSLNSIHTEQFLLVYVHFNIKQDANKNRSIEICESRKKIKAIPGSCYFSTSRIFIFVYTKCHLRMLILYKRLRIFLLYIPTFRMFKHAHRARSHICDPCVMMAKHNFTHLLRCGNRRILEFIFFIMF